MTEQTSDHDLLIAVSTKLDRVISDVRDLKDNLVSRVELLEKNSLDNEQYYQKHQALQSDVQKLEKQKVDDAEVAKIAKNISDNLCDHDKRIDSLENWRSGVVATCTLLGGLVTWFAIKLFEHISK